MTEEKNRWLKSIAVSLFVFTVFSLYLFLRRGFFDIYIANKALGSAAVIVSGMTLLLGPLSKKFPILHIGMTIRRHLGLCALGLALLHIVATLSQQARFPFPGYYMEGVTPFVMGLIAIAAWIYIASISNNAKILQLGPDVWKKRLRLGANIAFYAIFLHLTFMKYPGWLRWANGLTKQSAELANPQNPSFSDDG